MNDFTKEQLEDIKDLIDEHERHYGVYGQYMGINLGDKIRTMINNYCNHEEEYEDFNYQPMLCKKCLEIKE